MGIFQIHKEGKPLKVEGMRLKKKKKGKSVSLSVRVKERVEKETGIGCE